MNKKRAIVIVVDSMGCGALPDAMDYDDELTCNTLANLASKTGGLDVPNLEKMGFGNIIDIKGVTKTDTPTSNYGILKMKSKAFMRFTVKTLPMTVHFLKSAAKRLCWLREAMTT